ncbi:unannotated protein [freshwater metagenome]|uniref:Unannotated protein n=1 Tax=freshwater metagenome TaxID=449393 RepID=A0A6J6GSU6_9ZZZZ
MLAGAENVDGVDHAIGYGGEGRFAVAGGMAFADGSDLVGEPGAGEVGGIGIDDDVREQVAPGKVAMGFGIGDTDMHIAVDRGVATGPHLFDGPRNVGGRQVVEQDPVGEFAGHAEHLGIEGRKDDLGTAFIETDPEPETLDRVVVAGEVDLFAAQALTQEREVLAHLGHGAVAVVGTVPTGDDGRRRDADAEEDVAVGLERLKGRGAHGGEAGSAQLDRQHPGTEGERGLGCSDGGECGERLRTRGLGDPERGKAQFGGPLRSGESGLHPEGGEARIGDTHLGCGWRHGKRRYCDGVTVRNGKFMEEIGLLTNGLHARTPTMRSAVKQQCLTKLEQSD